MSIRSARALPGVIVLLSAGAASAGVLSDWNLIVQNNLTSTSEVEGRAAVGGNLGGPASNYGIKLTPAANYVSTDVLLVGGNITATNVNMNAGRLRLGGSKGSANINFNGGGGPVIQDPTTASQVAGLFSQVTSISSFLGSLAPTNSVTFPGQQPAGVTFNAVPNGDGVAVFSISASQLFGNNKVQSMDLNLGAATSVIINVTGDSSSWDAGNFVGNFNSAYARSHVLWNFVNANTINWSSGRTLSGALLAPNAHLTFTGTMEGSVFVKSLDQRGEVHLPTYQGYVPAPGALGLLGLAGLAGRRRR
jgi:choice-of-anchor A domain-containing protein